MHSKDQSPATRTFIQKGGSFGSTWTKPFYIHRGWTKPIFGMKINSWELDWTRGWHFQPKDHSLGGSSGEATRIHRNLVTSILFIVTDWNNLIVIMWYRDRQYFLRFFLFVLFLTWFWSSGISRFFFRASRIQF